jgi:hypothetical protein
MSLKDLHTYWGCLMSKIPKKHLVDRYPDSKLIRQSLLKAKKKKATIKKCKGECGNVDYKAMAYVAKRAVNVIENLAEAVNSMESKFSKNADLISKMMRQEVNKDETKE